MNMIRKVATRIRSFLTAPLLQQFTELHKLSQHTPNSMVQKALLTTFRQYYAQHNAAPMPFRDIGFRVNSQHDEDGILLYIFSLIGTSNMMCVEVCAGDGVECNTANLILNHRWIGLLCDGDERNVERARQYFTSHPDTKYWPPKIVQTWITRRNVDDVIRNNGFSGEIDLLSLDIDGVDYWIWKEINSITPRVVVLEFNHLWGPEESVTVPYSDDFVAEFSAYGSDYGGASLMAFVKLGKEKGYRLVGTNIIATNAFFIRNDILCDWLPEIEPANCFNHPRAQFGMSQRLPNVKHKAWVKV